MMRSIESSEMTWKDVFNVSIKTDNNVVDYILLGEICHVCVSNLPNVVLWKEPGITLTISR